MSIPSGGVLPMRCSTRCRINGSAKRITYPAVVLLPPRIVNSPSTRQEPQSRRRIRQWAPYANFQKRASILEWRPILMKAPIVPARLGTE